MLKKIALAVVALLVVFVAVVALQPSEWSVQREVTINAPAPVVYAQVADFHKWVPWSPWEGLDPNMKREYSGAESGVGAVYHWVGKEDVGEGEMKIDGAKPGEALAIKLDFIKPFESDNRIDFTFTPEGQGSKVTWKMTGHNNFMMKAFGLFMNMDKAVGGDFEKGLARLTKVSEAEAAEAAEAAAAEKQAADDAVDAGTP